MPRTEISVFFGDDREARVCYDTDAEMYKVLMTDFEHNIQKEYSYSYRQSAEDAAEDWCL